MTGATLEQARVAKVALRAQLTGMPELRGIGITFVQGGYALKVLLQRLPVSGVIPDDVDGVGVIVDVVGEPMPL